MSTFGRVLGLGLAMVVFSFGTASAEGSKKDRGDYARSGAHLMISGAFLLDQSESGSKLRIETENGWGIEATAGYRWSPHVDLELQAEFIYRDVGSSASGWMIPSAGARIKYIILTDRFQPFVSVGMGLLRAEETIEGENTWEWGGLARFGTGLDFYLTENVVFDFTFEYLHGTGSWHGLRDLRFALGPKYRF